MIPRAIGIEYIACSQLYRAAPGSTTAAQTGSGFAFATKEAIISAGTFNAPQLLKLSGIGPKAELQKPDIPVILNAPGAGTNMQDRYESGRAFLETFDDPYFDQWQNNQTDRSIYGTNGATFGLMWASNIAQRDETDIFVGGLPANFRGYFSGYPAAADLRTRSYLVLKAHSCNNAGTVTLTSTDSRDMPNITSNIFAIGGADDLQAFYEGVELAHAMFNKTIRPDGAFVETNPGPSIQSEAGAKSRMQTSTWGHRASCSVPIAALNNPNTVFDSSFRVKGIRWRKCLAQDPRLLHRRRAAPSTLSPVICDAQPPSS